MKRFQVLPPYFRGIGGLICVGALVWVVTGWMVIGTGSFHTATALFLTVLGSILTLAARD